MQFVMRVTGASLVNFMAGIKASAGRTSVNTISAIEQNFGRLEPAPMGIPINMPNMNGRLADGWVEAMSAHESGFERGNSHIMLNNRQLSGPAVQIDVPRTASARFTFASPVEAIGFSKSGFPLAETTKGRYLNCISTPVREAVSRRDDKGSFVYAETREPVLALITKLSFADESADLAILRQAPDFMHEELIAAYQSARERYLKSPRYFDNPDFDQSTDPLALGTYWYLEHQGNFNTAINATPDRATDSIKYRDFILEDHVWLTDHRRGDGSTLTFGQGTFPAEIESFLKAVNQVNGFFGANYADGPIYLEMHFREGMLRRIQKGQMPERFSLPMYFHNSGSLQWQIGLWV